MTRLTNLLQRVLGTPAPRPADQAAPAVSPTTPEAVAPETATFVSMSTDRALWRIARRNVKIGTVIDVGASNGMWSAVCEKHFPEANYLLVEAQRVHETDLQSYCAVRPKAQFVLAAAGDRVGEVYFDDSDPFGGVASQNPTAGARSVVPVTTLDTEIAKRKLPGPYLVKLDTHGFEVPILEGARKVLQETQLAVIESYNFRLSEDSLLFNEMVDYMRKGGFGVSDMSEPLWRQKDMALWQMDLFFQPLAREEFAYNAYR